MNHASMKIRTMAVLLITTGFFTGCGNSDKHRYQGYVEGENIYLASPYSGKLIQALVLRGERVKKGELLFKLDPYPQMLDIQEATASLKKGKQQEINLKKPRRTQEIDAIKAQIGQANEQIALAAIRVKRNQSLYAKHFVDKDTLDESQERHSELLYLKAQFEANLALAKEGSRIHEIKAQQEQVSELEAKLAQSEWELKQKTIYAPANGVIFDTYFKPGEFVDGGHPVAALLTPENFRIEFFVSADALTTLHIGQKIAFECDGCALNNHATIAYISPEAEYVPPLVYSRENKDKLVFRVKARIDHSENYKPGQPVIAIVADHE